MGIMNIRKKIDEQLTFATKKRVQASSNSVEYDRWVGYIQGLRFVQALIEGSREDFSSSKTLSDVPKKEDDLD